MDSWIIIEPGFFTVFPTKLYSSSFFLTCSSLWPGLWLMASSYTPMEDTTEKSSINKVKKKCILTRTTQSDRIDFFLSKPY